MELSRGFTSTEFNLHEVVLLALNKNSRLYVSLKTGRCDKNTAAHMRKNTKTRSSSVREKLQCVHAPPS